MAHQPLAPWGGTKGWYKVMAFMIQPKPDPKTGIYKLRLGVPDELVLFVGKKELKRSLGTKNAQEAKARAPAVANVLYGILTEARNRKDCHEQESKVSTSDLDTIVSRWLINERKRLGEPDILSRYTIVTDDGLEAATEWFSEPLVELTKPTDANQAQIEERFLRHMEAFVDEALAISSCQLITHKPRLYLAESIARAAIKLCNSVVDSQGFCRREAVRFPNLDTPSTQRSFVTDLLADSGLEVIDNSVPQIRIDEAQGGLISKDSTISQLIEWVHSQKKIELGADLNKWMVERSKACQRATEYFGTKTIGDIRKLDMRNLLIAITQCPNRPKKDVRNLSLREQIEVAKQKNLKLVSLRTANKEIKLLSGYFQQAVKLELIPMNPCHGVSLDVPHRDPLRGQGYSNAEVQKIFSLPLFSEIPSKKRALYGEAPYWLNVILAYTGARAEEIAQLYVDDIQQDPDNPSEWYIHIRAGRSDQSVKREKSRKVPIPQSVIDLGLFDYVKTLPPDGRLFPILKANGKSKYHTAVSKYLKSQYALCNIPLFSELEPLHAFRHRFATEARKVMREDVHNAITGHSNAGNVGRTYGAYEGLHSAINKMPVFIIPKWKP